jgi:hypothetical protein
MVDLPRNTPAEVAAAGFLQRSSPGIRRPTVGFVGLGEYRLPVSGFHPLTQTNALLVNHEARTDQKPLRVIFSDSQTTDSAVRTASASNQDPPQQPDKGSSNELKAPGSSDSVPRTPRSDVQSGVDSPGKGVISDAAGETKDLLSTEESGTQVPRERLTDNEKAGAKRFLAARLHPVELTDTEYDTVVPISLEVFLDMLDTGYISSVEENGYIHAFDRASLAQSVEDIEEGIDEDIPSRPFYLSPLRQAQQVAQIHGVLAELRLPITTPKDNPALWAAIERNQNEDVDVLDAHGYVYEDVDIAKENLRGYQGILVAVANPPSSEQINNGSIHYTQIRAVMGIGTERGDIAAFLDDVPNHPSLRSNASYTYYGTSIRLDKNIGSRGTRDYEEYERPEEVVVMPPRLRGTLDKLKMMSTPTYKKSNTIEEEVFGYLSVPTYQQETTTQRATIPDFGQIHLYNHTEPLITRETLNTFARLHPDRFNPDIAQQVGDALFNPYTLVADNSSAQLPTKPASSEDVPAWEAFSQWKQAGLHLRIFGAPTAAGEVQSEQGIVASSIEHERLSHLQGLDITAQTFLTELATELMTTSRTQKENQQLARKIADNIKRQRNGVISIVDSETTIVTDFSLGPIEVTLGVPIFETERDALLERGATESEITRGVASLTFGDSESGATMQAVISDEGVLTFLPVSAYGVDLEFSSDDHTVLQTALNIASLIGYYPKLIRERFGSYANFRSYLDPDEDMQGIELIQETNGERLYQLGLDVQVTALEIQGEESIPEVAVAERFMNHFDPQSISI